MKRIRDYFFKYKESLLYLFFGGCTTLLNTTCYYIFYEILKFSNINSNIIAWILAVLFAFITNKVWVFNSRKFDLKTFIKEGSSFFLFRVLTGILDLIIMYIGVDIFKFNGLIMKIISNIIVIVLNYLASKMIIFKKEE